MSQSHQIIQDVIVECNKALFEHYNVPLIFAPNAIAEQIWEEELVLAGLIGFTSTNVRGSMVLAVSSGPLSALTEKEQEYRDWIQELANQLLGRAKNRMLAYDVDLHMTTPLSLRGLHLILEANSEENRPLLFHSNKGGAVCVLVDVEFTPNYELVLSQDADSACPDEGELLLF